MKFYTPSQLGRTQSLTPEGFLVCHDVPIARTGEMIYVADEVPVDAGRDGLIRIMRDADEVFRPETIASFIGKPITDDHPDEEVSPANWRDHGIGHIQNVRRGDGQFDQFLLADLFITDQAAIDAVRSGKREVSCGYDAEYEQVEPGLGIQKTIIGNHLALVDKGRCGPRCAIGDSRSPTQETTMSKTKRTLADRIRTAFKARDEAALEEELEKTSDAEGEEEKMEEEPEMEKTSDSALKSVADSLAKVADGLAKLAAGQAKLAADMAALKAKDAEGDMDDESETMDDDPDDETKGEKMTADSAGLSATFQDTLARADALSPGIKAPTYDGKATRKAVVDAMCGLRRKALTAARDAEKTRDHVAAVIPASADIGRMTCDAVEVAFLGASNLVRAANNRQAPPANLFRDQNMAVAGEVASINRRNAEFWNPKRD